MRIPQLKSQLLWDISRLIAITSASVTSRRISISTLMGGTYSA
jgi:hypothetical protein